MVTRPMSEQDMDQLIMGNKDLAVLEANYYKRLIAEGVPPEHAVKLTSAWLASLLGLYGAKPPDDKLEK